MRGRVTKRQRPEAPTRPTASRTRRSPAQPRSRARPLTTSFRPDRLVRTESAGASRSLQPAPPPLTGGRRPEEARPRRAAARGRARIGRNPRRRGAVDGEVAIARRRAVAARERGDEVESGVDDDVPRVLCAVARRVVREDLRVGGVARRLARRGVEVDRDVRLAHRAGELDGLVVGDEAVVDAVDDRDALQARGGDVGRPVDHRALGEGLRFTLDRSAGLPLDVGDRAARTGGARLAVGLGEVVDALDTDPVVEDRAAVVGLAAHRRGEPAGVPAHRDPEQQALLEAAADALQVLGGGHQVFAAGLHREAARALVARGVAGQVGEPAVVHRHGDQPVVRGGPAHVVAPGVDVVAVAVAEDDEPARRCAPAARRSRTSPGRRRSGRAGARSTDRPCRGLPGPRRARTTHRLPGRSRQGRAGELSGESRAERRSVT